MRSGKPDWALVLSYKSEVFLVVQMFSGSHHRDLKTDMNSAPRNYTYLSCSSNA